MSKYLTLLCGIFMCLPFSQAQQHQYSWKIGVHGGFATYYGDLTHQFFEVHHKMKAPFQNLDFWAYGLSLEYHFSKTFGIRLLGLKSQIVGNDRNVVNGANFNRALNVQTDLVDVSLLGAIYLDNGLIFGHKAVISPYFLIGGGLTYFDAKADLLAGDGNRYYYWSDRTIRNIDETAANASQAVVIEQDGKYETSLAAIKTEGFHYLPITWHVAAGVGLKFRLSKRFHLHLEAIMRYTGTDYLDDLSGDYLPYYTDNFQGYAANPSNDNRPQRGNSPEMNDWTGAITLSLHYSFGQKTYDIRPSIIYTPILLVADSVKKDTVVLSENQKDSNIVNSTIANNSSASLVALDTIKTNKKDSLAVLSANDTMIQKITKDSLHVQSINPNNNVYIIENNNTTTDTIYTHKIHGLELKNQQQFYEYQLQLLKQDYEYQLKIQDLENQLELEKLKKSQPQEVYERELQKLKFEQELKLQKQDYEYQLKIKDLQHALELEKRQSPNTSFRDTSTHSSSNLVKTENKTNNSTTYINENSVVENQLADLLIAIEKQQKQLDYLVNLNHTNSKKDTVFNNNSNQNISKELDVLRTDNLRLKQEINILKTSYKIDSLPNTNPNSVKKEIIDPITINKNLTEQLQKANLQNQQQKTLIDSLLIQNSLLQSQQKNISNELAKFLNKESSGYITKVYFDVNKTNITIQAEETLTTLIQHLKNYPDVRFLVKGFASRKGDAAKNQQLSNERAIVVAGFLERLGVPKSHLKTASLGSSQSVEDKDVDRRAEVHLYFE